MDIENDMDNIDNNMDIIEKLMHKLVDNIRRELNINENELFLIKDQKKQPGVITDTDGLFKFLDGVLWRCDKDGDPMYDAHELLDGLIHKNTCPIIIGELCNPWINVNEKLPDESGYYLIGNVDWINKNYYYGEESFNIYNVVHFSKVHQKFNCFDNWNEKEADKLSVHPTHWMSVPQIKMNNG